MVYNRNIKDDELTITDLIEPKNIYCIYYIKNIINDKMYIGQTKNIKRRRLSHYGKLSKGYHPNYKLQDDWNKYGGNSFKITVLEYCDESEVNKREMYYISLFNSVDDGYNISIGGTNGNNFPRKRIKQYDLDGNFIKLWESAAEAARFYNVKRGYISGAAKKHHKTLNYQWCYEDEEISDFYLRKDQKPIAQYDLNNNLVNVYKTMIDIEKQNEGYKRNNICAAIRKDKTSYGYKWKYIRKEEYYEYSRQSNQGC